MTVKIIEHGFSFNGEIQYDIILDDTKIVTTVTQDPTRVSYWLNMIEISNMSRLYRLLVGLDIEWRPNFIRGAAQNPAATLQLCVGNSCLIYQILQAPTIPNELITFLQNGNYRFVGVGIDNDVKKLWTDYSLNVSNVVDLREWAAVELNKNDLRNVGLKDLVKEVVGIEIEKPQSVRVSYWDNRWLSYDQISYACLDAYLSFEVGRRLSAWY